MSEKQIVRRVCDYCSETQEFGPEQITAPDALRVAGWIHLVRVFLVNGTTHPVQKHACKDSCAQNIISLGMLDLPQEIKDMQAEEKRLAAEFEKKRAANANTNSAPRPTFGGVEATPVLIENTPIGEA